MMDSKKASTDPDKSDTLSRMERDWDARAREAPEYYIATGRRQWRMDDFFQGGESNVNNEILADADLIRQGRRLSQMRVLEIGCGVGRMTRAMAAYFGEVHAVDISAEMIALAKKNLSDLQNVFLYKNSGMDLSEFPDRGFDFAFSFIVFQHIPDLDIIENYVREVHRCLKPGAVFKFQVHGGTNLKPTRDDTWNGWPLSMADARALADGCGFELLRAAGEGTQYFWLWFRKVRCPWVPTMIRYNSARAHTRLQGVIEAGRLWCAKRVAITFSPQSVRVGDWYSVSIPTMANQTIDVAYELTVPQCPTPISGVVSNWCELDSQGETRIVVPAEHPIGIVRITRVRSRTKDGRWHLVRAEIQVAGVE